MRILKKYKMPLLIAFATAQLTYLLTLPESRMSLALLARAMLSGQYTAYVLLAPCLLGLGVLFNRRLQALDWRWLEWSPWHIKSNVALIPLKSKWLWAPYGLLLASCMPLLALFEEIIFRSGTTNWVRGVLWGTIAFGLLHLLSCVSVRMTVYLALLGAVLVQVYMLDGLMAAFVLHACYNLLALTLLIAETHLKRGPALLRRAGASVGAAAH